MAKKGNELSSIEKKGHELSLTERKIAPSYTLPDLVSPAVRDKMMISRLGPGSYNFSLSTLSGPSHRFAESLRFQFDDPFAKYMRMGRKASDTGFQLPDINLDSFRPPLKLSRIKEEACNLTNRLMTVKITKKKIQTDKKEKILKKLKDKNEKYAIRKRVKEFKALAYKMLYLFTVLGGVWHMSSAIRKVKDNRERLARFLRIFGYICLAIGKFRLTLRKFRVFAACRIINKAVSRMKVWITKKKISYRALIVTRLETYLKRPLLQIALVKFATKVVSIQRYWRKSLIFKSNALLAKLQIFRLIEASQLSHLKNKKKYKIPKKVILKELLRIRKAKLTTYITAMKKHKQQCNTITRTNTKAALKVSLTYGFKSNSIPITKYPKAPYVNYTIKKKLYVQSISTLMHRKSLWET